VALFPGGFGTMDEGFEVLTLMQTGKARILPVVFVDKPGGYYWKTVFGFLKEQLLGNGLVSLDDFHLFRLAHDVNDAVSEILHFYRNFRSYRWVGKKLVIRLQHPLTPKAISALNKHFHDVIIRGSIESTEPLPEERNEPELADVPRLVFTPNRHHFGRIRALIDAINDSEIKE
jgi:hypothetical protein